MGIESTPQYRKILDKWFEFVIIQFFSFNQNFGVLLSNSKYFSFR